MAIDQHTASRRGMLGLIAAAPLVAAAAPAPVHLPTHWESAKATYIAARDAEDLYDRTIAIPSWKASELPGGPAYDERLTEESDRLCDLRCAAEESIIAAPAPDLSAVIWKIEHARDRWKAFEDWPATWWDAVMTDLRRLSGNLH